MSYSNVANSTNDKSYLQLSQRFDATIHPFRLMDPNIPNVLNHVAGKRQRCLTTRTKIHGHRHVSWAKPKQLGCWVNNEWDTPTMAMNLLDQSDFCHFGHDIKYSVTSDGNLCHTPLSFVCPVSVIDGRIQSLSMQIVWQCLRFTGTFAILEETNGVGVGAAPQGQVAQRWVWPVNRPPHSTFSPKQYV